MKVYIFLRGKCVVPENIFTPPTEGIGNSWGVGGSQRLKILKKCIEFNWNFQRVGGSYKKSLPWGRYGYFMELHNGTLVLINSTQLIMYHAK